MSTIKAAVVCLLGLAASGLTHAQAERRILDIQPQPIKLALRDLGEQTGIQILFRAEDVAAEMANTPRISGTMSPREALEKMLEKLPGLECEWMNDRTVLIFAKDRTRAERAGLVKEGQGMRLARAEAAPAAPTLPESGRTLKEEQEPLAEIIVTGSNIRSSIDAEKRSIPVDVISAEQISKTGANTLADVLATNPALTNGSLAEQSDGGRGYANLRGLGAQYTLVLLNGRRMSANDPTNILTIPAEAVERIEILKSGASAVYGSDAVAGVINVILKSEAQGLHASLTYGDTSQGGAKTTDASLFGGSETDSARYFFLFNHMTRSEIRARSRDITSTSDKRMFGGYDERSSIGNPARIGGIAGSPDLIADTTRIPVGGYSLDPADYRPYNPAADLFDVNAIVNPSIISAPERLTIIGNFERDFFDGNLTFFTSGLFWQMKEKLYRAQIGLFGTGLSFSDPVIGPIPASNPYNPFGQDVTDLNYRPLELGRQLQETNAQAHRLNAGLRGMIGQWQVESAISWYRSEEPREYHNSVLKSGLREAINRPGADAFNPFCNQCNTPAQLAGLLTTTHLEFGFRSDMMDLRMSGPLLELPTGTLSAAAGAEYRKEGVFVDFPQLNAGTVGGFGNGAYDLDRTIRSAFAEVKVPLLKSADGSTDSPLEFTAAARFEKYSDFGSETSPLATLRYAFLDGQATLRASYSKAFLAPYMEYATEKIGGSYTDFLIDPLTGEPVETFVVYSGSPDIEPERSTTRSLGIILSPNALPGVTLTLDAYEIEQTDFTAFNPQSSMDGVAPGSVTRGEDIGPGGEDAILRTYYFNINERNSAGYELSVNYKLPRLAMGQFELDLGVFRLSKYEVFGLVPDQLVDLAGGYDPTAGPLFGSPTLPKTRAALGVSWEQGAWSMASQWHYMSSFRETEESTIGSYSTTDFQLSYAFEAAKWLPLQDARLTLGVENAFDRKVPFLTVINDFNKYENDLRGRFIYARMSVDF